VTEPTRRERTRPVELLALSGGIALFASLIALLATRSPLLAIVGFGVVFIVALVTLAMLEVFIRPGDPS
jgi:hypothetical protein